MTYSRFRADSELAVLVTDAGRDHLVSPLLARALGTALHAARATDGAVDPTIGRALRLLGYDDDFARLPRDGTPGPFTVASVPGWQAIRFDPATRHVRIPAGVELDLGATGKGLAADLAAETALDAMDGAGVLVSLGGDVATDGQPPVGGWRVLLADDNGAARTVPARWSASTAARSRRRARPSGAGSGAASSVTTSSTRRRDSRPRARGGPPRSWPRPVPTPMRPRRRPSSWVIALRPGSRATASRPGWSRTTAASSASPAGPRR